MSGLTNDSRGNDDGELRRERSKQVHLHVSLQFRTETYLVENDVRVDHKPVAVAATKLGVPGVSLLGEHRSESREVGTDPALGEAAGNIIAHIAFTEDCRQTSPVTGAYIAEPFHGQSSSGTCSVPEGRQPSDA